MSPYTQGHGASGPAPKPDRPRHNHLDQSVRYPGSCPRCKEMYDFWMKKAEERAAERVPVICPSCNLAKPCDCG